MMLVMMLKVMRARRRRHAQQLAQQSGDGELDTRASEMRARPHAGRISQIAASCSDWNF